MSSRAALVFLLVSFAWCSSTYAGTMYLVGAHIYRTDATGAYSDDPFPAYTYSTNSLTRHSPLYLNGSVTGLDASFELSLGSNTFTFAGLPPLNPGGFIGLNLFFSPNSTPFNAVPGSVVPGDITLFTATTANGLNGNVTNAGTSILSYGVDNFDAPLALANGKSALVLGDRMVGVSAFTSNTRPSGSFKIGRAHV